MFALSLQPAAQGRALVLRDGPVHELAPETTGAQSVEATVVNAGTAAVLAATTCRCASTVPGARTVEAARRPPPGPR